MKHRDTEFAYGVSKVRARMAKGLSKEFFHRLSDAADVSVALSLLREKGYQGETAEKMLEGSLEETYHFLYELSPQKEFLDVFRLRRDYHNLKVLLKAKQQGQNADDLLYAGGCYSLDLLKKAVGNENFSALGFMEKAAREANNLYQQGMPYQADCRLDTAAFTEMRQKAKESQMAFLEELVVVMIDLANLQSYLRLWWRRGSREEIEEAFISGGTLPRALFMQGKKPAELLSETRYQKLSQEADNASAFWQACQDYLDTILKQAKWDSFSPAPLVSYLFFKERETALLRRLLRAKEKGLSYEEIRERVGGTDA